MKISITNEISSWITLVALVATGVAMYIHNNNDKRKKKQAVLQEDNEVLLYRFDPVVGKPYGNKSVSPFSLKVECFLRLADIPYTAQPFEFNSILKNKKQKLPTARIAGQYIADSTFILEHLMVKEVQQSSRNLCDSLLSDYQRAVGYSLKAMCEDSLYFIIGYFRYQWNPGFQVYMEENPVILTIPAIIRPLMVWYARRAILSQLWQQGIGRHSQDEVELIGRDTIDAIEALLPSVSNNSRVSVCTTIQVGTSGPFLFGSHPSSFDATLFSFLSGIVESGVESPLKVYALTKPRIMAYVAYINNRYWSEVIQ